MVSRKKNFWRVIFFAFVVTFVFLFVRAVSAEEISGFKAEVVINNDASLVITENINYDFGQSLRHGIFRDIPIKYSTPSGNRRIYLDVQEVRRDGSVEPYELIRSGDNLQIKIGDANREISGPHSYQIVYSVDGAINYFADFDELYWNITGNDWPVDIAKAQGNFTLPQAVSAAEIKASCYQGEVGSTDKCQVDVLGDSVLAFADGILQSGQGLTLAVGFPKGIVREPSQTERLFKWLKANGITFLPLLVLVAMFLLWYNQGRDPKGKGTIIAQYEPPTNLKPTLVGAMVDEKVDNRDITAGLIYLARQGFVKIIRLEKSGWLSGVDYELKLLKDLSGITSRVEKDIAEIIFGQESAVGKGKKLSQLKKDKSLAKEMKSLKLDINEEMVKLGFFAKNPAKVKGLYTSVGAFLIFIPLFIGLSGSWLFALIVSGVIIVLFGLLMGKKTKLGAETKEYILGFKEFLSVTDKDRFKFHNAPNKKPEQFMEYLPYAVAMGVEKEWADQFKDMYIEKPSWYEGNYTGAFVISHFINDISAFSNKMNSGLSQASHGGAGSTGGGFSGGGFGGGGGGSW